MHRINKPPRLCCCVLWVILQLVPPELAGGDDNGHSEPLVLFHIYIQSSIWRVHVTWSIARHDGSVPATACSCKGGSAGGWRRRRMSSGWWRSARCWALCWASRSRRR